MTIYQGLLSGLLVSLALAPQGLPDEVTLKTGEQRYCRAMLTDLKGVSFAAVVEASADGESTIFQVYEEHPTYKAETDQLAFKYASKRRATITVRGRAIDTDDIVNIDGAFFFASVEKPVAPEAIRFSNDVFACIAKKKS